MPWAKAGYVQAEEQLPVQAAAARPAIAAAGKVNMSAVKDNKIVFSGKNLYNDFRPHKGYDFITFSTMVRLSLQTVVDQS